ncbi:diguanylate cyclase [Cytobacillus sp. FJAT-54145]|uniref:Diguanylate cyclase n=1 Tax=Cytobacillus spartinae TaxID=3299023 RepID=A0ABW6K5A2_9BACI
MKFIKESLKHFLSTLKGFIDTNKGTNIREFREPHNRYLLNRLNIVSITLSILYIFYLYVDIIMLKNVDNISYRYILIFLHLATLMVALIYLFLYRRIKHNRDLFKTNKPTILVNLYIMMFALMGVGASLNSQQLTGNIDAYIIIIIAIAVLFPINPLHLLAIYITNHSLFLIGLSFFSRDEFSLVTKQINSTSTVIISFFISVAFYSYRKRDFYNDLMVKEKEENFRKLFEINPFPLILTRLNTGEIIKVNKSALEFYNVSLKELTYKKAKDFYRTPDDRLTIVNELLETGKVKNHIVEQRISNGEYRWVIINYELIEYANEKCLLAGVTDITAFKKMEAELTEHASIDALTGILNRRSGISLLEEEIEKARNTGEEFILCFIDINNLKVVNDQYGHAEGDQLIKTVCNKVKENIQEDIFFRYGGDEFIILFRNKTLACVDDIWETIIESLSLNSSNNYPITISHGLYQFGPGQEVSIDEMIHLADQAMYKEKSLLKQKASYGRSS